MATTHHTPVGRGYDTSLIYYHHQNDYWDFTYKSCPPNYTMFDLWNKYDDTPANATYGEPAKDYLNSMGCTSTTQNASGTCVYEDDLFEERVHSIVAKHDPTTPLFVFWATHTVHGPLQPPDAAYDNFSFINVDNRRKYHSMVNYIDGTIGRVVQSFKNKGMFDELLIVSHALSLSLSLSLQVTH